MTSERTCSLSEETTARPRICACCTSGRLSGRQLARLSLLMAASVHTRGMKIVLDEMSRPPPEKHDVPDPGQPDFGACDRDRKKFEAARKKFEAAEKAYNSKVQKWVRERVSVACALAHAVKDSEYMKRYRINPQGALTHAKMPKELTLEDGEDAAEFVRDNMEDPKAQRWRAQMSSKRKVNMSTRLTRLVLNRWAACALCAGNIREWVWRRGPPPAVWSRAPFVITPKGRLTVATSKYSRRYRYVKKLVNAIRRGGRGAGLKRINGELSSLPLPRENGTRK